MTNKKTLKSCDKSLLKKALTQSRQQRSLQTMSSDQLIDSWLELNRTFFNGIRTGDGITRLADGILEAIPTIDLREAFVLQLKTTLKDMSPTDNPHNSPVYEDGEELQPQI